MMPISSEPELNSPNPPKTSQSQYEKRQGRLKSECTGSRKPCLASSMELDHGVLYSGHVHHCVSQLLICKMNWSQIQISHHFSLPAWQCI